MKNRENDTIAATATPVGQGAISVIRVSGRDAFQIGDRVFCGRKTIAGAQGFTVHFGRISDERGKVLDEALATVFREPHSYTGENMVEFSCHGGVYVTGRVLQAILAAGARHAEAGEFTKRAFLNGKMDLSRAEAVADLIAAGSERARSLSLEQLEGKLGDRVSRLRSELMDLCSLLELNLDFSEEGIDLVGSGELIRRIESTRRSLEQIAESFELGRVYKEGVAVVLAGKPNAGKSSLFNALLREDRAIVTAVPGTTRDALEEGISISGILFRLIDTAGLRETEDLVEVEGVIRSKSIIKRGDIIIVVIDASEPGGVEMARAQLEPLAPHQRLLLAFNKIDLLDKSGDLPEQSSDIELAKREILVSAKTGAGLEELRKALVSQVSDSEGEREDTLYITSSRHRETLVRACGSLENGLQSIRSGATGEFVAFDIREAVEALSEITGEITSEEILNNIFGQFCVGK